MARMAQHGSRRGQQRDGEDDEGTTLGEDGDGLALRPQLELQKTTAARRCWCSCSWAEISHWVRGLPNPFAEDHDWISNMRLGWVTAE